jgi:hypothetical protein
VLFFCGGKYRERTTRAKDARPFLLAANTHMVSKYDFNKKASRSTGGFFIMNS